MADVFRFRDRTSEGNAIAFKTVRADSLLRIQNEAAILKRMAKDCPAVGLVAGPNFAAALAEALRDAAGALLREIDFVGEAANLRDARAFYKFNRRIRVPAATIGVPIDRGIFMEFVEGVPLLDAPLDYESRRDAARLVFRRLVLDPLFSGLPQSIFHADPHAGNLMVQTQKHAPLTLVLLDWSQAGRLSAPLRHALIALCLYCVTGDEPSPDVLTRLLESNRKSIRIPLPQGAGDPLHAAFEIVQQLALQGHPVPLNLLLLRKSFLTLDGITRQLDPDFNAWQETLAYASGVFASEAVVRTWSIQFPWLDRPDFYRSGLPTRTLAAHFAGTMQKRFVQMHKTLLARFGNPCDVPFRSSGITRSPHKENKERSKEKMSATDTKKATAATSETIDEVFHEAMRSYEKALKSGIQLQEESVNLWKDLLTKLGSPEELQAKLESMTADAFPKARKRMEEFVETFNRTSNQTIDLFEKTLGVYQATSVTDAQRRVQDLVESSLSTLRVNVHSALNTNAKIIASWKELVDRFGPAVK